MCEITYDSNVSELHSPSFLAFLVLDLVDLTADGGEGDAEPKKRARGLGMALSRVPFFLPLPLSIFFFLVEDL